MGRFVLGCHFGYLCVNGTDTILNEKQRKVKRFFTESFFWSKMLENDEKRAILDRTKEVLGLSGHGSDKALAEKLGVSSSVLTAWKSRNQIDLPKLRNILTPSQFVYVMGGAAPSLAEAATADYVSRTEFLEQLLAMSKRIDRLEAVLKPASEETEE